MMAEEGMGRTDMAMVSRITRDLKDAVMLMDTSGSIVYFNPRVKELLGRKDIHTGMKYALLMDGDKGNDELHQFVLDSVYDKDRVHKGELRYKLPEGGELFLQISSSYAFSEDQREKIGVILQFSDITEEHRLRIRYFDATKILIAMLAIFVLYNFAYCIWIAAGKELLTAENMTTVFMTFGVIGTLFGLRFTSLTVADFGLGTKGLKKSLLSNALLTAVMIMIMLTVKLLLRKNGVMDPEAPFFRWDLWSLGETIYPLTVFSQELITRGAMQGALRMVLPENTPDVVAIIISSLYFGALHLHKGLAFMIGATLLLSVFGFIYSRQGTIWGLCIPHYFLGLSLTVIWGA